MDFVNKTKQSCRNGVVEVMETNDHNNSQSYNFFIIIFLLLYLIYILLLIVPGFSAVKKQLLVFFYRIQHPLGHQYLVVNQQMKGNCHLIFFENVF